MSGSLLTTIRDLHRRRGRERRGLALAEGVRLVEEALAARVPIRGAAVVAKLMARMNQVAGVLEITTVWLNGGPAARIDMDGDPTVVSLVVRDGRVSRIYAIRNPDKLTRLREPAALAR